MTDFSNYYPFYMWKAGRLAVANCSMTYERLLCDGYIRISYQHYKNLQAAYAQESHHADAT